jgi:hypothetical protein
MYFLNDADDVKSIIDFSDWLLTLIGYNTDVNSKYSPDGV